MNIAFIPVRGGSKSIPLKNIKVIAGKPLVYWTVKAASECSNIDKVYVATDSQMIKDVILSFLKEDEIFSKVCVIGRSEESASDTASTESAMLEFAKKYEFDNIVLIQATSPLLKKEDLDGGFALFEEGDTESVLSVVRQKRFLWKEDKEGVQSLNYDVSSRPRRQEFGGYLVENGAFYITSKRRLMQTKNRISGKIRCYEMDENTYYEIDEPEDWQIIEHQLLNAQKQRLRKQIPDIKMFLTDCDGCLTDGGMYYSENGDELKKFNTKDGMGFSMLRQAGIITGIITGEDKQLNRMRADKLHADILKMGVKDKSTVVRELCNEHDIALSEVAYVGDDINDLDVIRIVGFGCSVADGCAAVRQAAKYVTTMTGGNGAVREVIDLILSGRYKGERLCSL